MKLRDFLYRLFFTRDDDLDVLQLLFIAWVGFVAFVVVMVGLKAWSIPTAAYTLLGAIFATLAIAGTPKWVATLIAKSKTPGEVGQAIASSEPDLYRDDERG